MMAAAEETRRKGLGRGLSALLGDDEAPVVETAVAEESATRPTKTVPIEFITANPKQPRKRFDDAAIDGLVESVREKGILQPILVRPHPTEANVYEIVAGERRWRAAQRAKLHEVPVLVRDLSDRDTLEIALVENIHREDLTPLEEAEGYQRLIDEFSHTQDALANAIGKSRSHIANMLRLLSLPEEVKSMVDDGLLTAGHARALLGTPNAEDLAHIVVKKELSVRQTEKLAQNAKQGSVGNAVEKIAKAVDQRDADTIALEKSLTDHLGLKVELKGAGETGSVVIHYKSLDQLDGLLERLNTE
ncbi:ParB/RepB/Spo0J family partition protein [Hwanghaeella grinnelliae]|uniref:ParB/RepB/Spo0J family partition protein n=1 Tax=Hwanghaeella grinnelliae TaxID=2500179 RepID=A0A437QP43_9PROT|nr:ParB/RepB/Spo0J family partition protein [Hwanghaeella grinnelliae]RVU36245.1 ParB/RepB/Spo0J family partition protein [Hwanghaeella grinnelliae]